MSREPFLKEENSIKFVFLKSWMIYRYGFILTFLFFATTSWSQYTYTGDAAAGDCGCHDVTQDINSQTGSFFKGVTVDLLTPWSLEFKVNFGCDDDGGEGMAFVMQASAWTMGSGNDGLGYQGIAGDVLAVEFDTRDNDAAGEVSNSDVAHDHISLQDNGDTDHDVGNPNNLLGISPAQIIPGFDDVEDCANHYVQIDWSPGAFQTIDVYVDGSLSLTYTGNMLLSQFSGSTIVTWGWTGSTGASASNQQIVCTVFAPPIDIEADATYCDGDAIADLTVVSATSGPVTWYDDADLTSVVGGGLTFSPSTTVGTTTYYATETEGSLGCEGDPDSVTITINPIPPAPLVSGPIEYCQDDIPTPLSAETTYGGDVTWYDNPPPAGILSTLNEYNPPTGFPGIFNYYVTETAEGCEGPATLVTVTIKPKPDPPGVTGTLTYCEGDVPTALTATPSAGGTIDWYTGSGGFLGTGTTYTPTLVPGTNTVVATETLAGCTSEDTVITIIVDPAPFVDLPLFAEMCKGETVLITAETNGYPILWSNGAGGNPIDYWTDETGYLYLTSTNPDCGSATDSILVIVNELPYVAVSEDTAVGLGAEIKLYATSGADNVTYTWVPPIEECIWDNCALVYAAPDQATIYIVTTTDENGCTHSDTVFVDIIGLMEVFVPNVFSPNNDGSNDLLEVLGPKLYDFEFRIYDRWGKMVFQSEDQREGWDGTFGGTPLTPQTFVYMVRGETILGKKIAIEGNVSIIK